MATSMSLVSMLLPTAPPEGAGHKPPINGCRRMGSGAPSGQLCHASGGISRAPSGHSIAALAPGRPGAR
jgi:hypothetical protein